MRIDWWTLGLQTVNVLILIWILSRFLFKPVVAIIEERRAAAAKLLSDAEAEKTQGDCCARGRRGGSRENRRGAGRGPAPGGGGRGDPARRGPRLRPRRRRTAARRHGGGHARARAAGAAAASARAIELAVDIAGKLIARLPDSARVDGFIDGLAEALASLPDASRDGIGVSGRARLTAPRALTPQEAQSCRDAFARALGRPLDFVVATDPGLIAGLELETPHAVVRNSIRSDLNRIVEELTRHDRVQH